MRARTRRSQTRYRSKYEYIRRLALLGYDETEARSLMWGQIAESILAEYGLGLEPLEDWQRIQWESDTNWDRTPRVPLSEERREAHRRAGVPEELIPRFEPPTGRRIVAKARAIRGWEYNSHANRLFNKAAIEQGMHLR